jgi:hypothetical protein
MWKDYNSGYGRNAAFDDWKGLARDQVYLKDMKDLIVIVARDAYAKDSYVTHHLHRLQPDIDDLLSVMSGDQVRIVSLTGTGSDANGMLLSLAHHFVNLNKPKKHKRVDGHVMVAFGCTVSSRLPLGQLCTRPGLEPAPEFLGADCTDYKRSMVVNFPLSTAYMQEMEALLKGEPVNTDILTQEEAAALQDFRTRVRTLRDKGQPVGVLLVELVTAGNMLGYTAAFLHNLRKACTEEGVALVVDEVLTALRCGHIFSYSYYRDIFKPDFVTVGKAMLFCGVLSIDAPPANMYWKLNGNVTSATVSCQLQSQTSEGSGLPHDHS